jgi:hypothetical protein
MLKVLVLVLVLVLVPHSSRNVPSIFHNSMPVSTSMLDAAALQDRCCLSPHLHHSTVFIDNSRQQRRQVLADRRGKSDKRDGACEAQPLWHSWDLRKRPPPFFVG